MDVTKHFAKTKQASRLLSLLGNRERNNLLQQLADKLRSSCNIILQENAKDLTQMSKENPMYDRLLLTDKRIDSMASDIESVINLSSPLNKVLTKQSMENGLVIEKVAVPLGTVAVIYESRPNVTIDIFTLCFKTGNACILRGGKEAFYSNQILVDIINQSLVENNLDTNILYLLPPTRENTNILLQATGLIDVCIARGSQSLINFVRDNAKIPFIETGAGIVHTYFDLSGDIVKGSLVIDNAKTRRVSVCNALDCLLIHQQRLQELFALIKPLAEHEVEIFADQESYAVLATLYPEHLLHKAQSEHYSQEFLSYKMAIKTVATVEEAVGHIMQHTSGHSEAIIAKDKQTIDYFKARVDAAVIYINTSTAFTDGGQFGMGSEIGISTGKLHARGPMGFAALTSYKWIVTGDGHIRER